MSAREQSYSLIHEYQLRIRTDKRPGIEGCSPGTSFQIPAAMPTSIQPQQTT